MAKCWFALSGSDLEFTDVIKSTAGRNYLHLLENTATLVSQLHELNQLLSSSHARPCGEPRQSFPPRVLAGTRERAREHVHKDNFHRPVI